MRTRRSPRNQEILWRELGGDCCSRSQSNKAPMTRQECIIDLRRTAAKLEAMPWQSARIKNEAASLRKRADMLERLPPS